MLRVVCAQVKEMVAVVQVRKYRELKKRYHDEDAELPSSSASASNEGEER